MTNREYQHKQHRGSSPSRNADTGFTRSDGVLPPEEWINLTWYPVSSTPPAIPPEQSAAEEKK